MAKVHIESVPELIKKAGEIRKQLALGTRRIGNVHIGGPFSPHPNRKHVKDIES